MPTYPKHLNVRMTETIWSALIELGNIEPTTTNKTAIVHHAIIAARDKQRLLRKHGTVNTKARMYADGSIELQRKMP